MASSAASRSRRLPAPPMEMREPTCRISYVQSEHSTALCVVAVHVRKQGIPGAFLDPADVGGGSEVLSAMARLREKFFLEPVCNDSIPVVSSEARVTGRGNNLDDLGGAEQGIGQGGVRGSTAWG